jgi:MFS family permease
MMMSILMVGTPLGIVIGYAMTMFIIRADWRWQISFYIQAGIMALYSIILLLLPNVYFSPSLRCINPPNVFEEQLNKFREQTNKTKNKSKKSEDIPKSKKKKVEDDTISLFQHKIESGSKIKDFFRDLCILIRIKVNKFTLTL